MCDVHLLAKEHAFNKYVATFEGSLSMNMNEGYLDFCGVITHLVTHHLNISTSFFFSNQVYVRNLVLVFIVRTFQPGQLGQGRGISLFWNKY
jgi:hypothetical protein